MKHLTSQLCVAAVFATLVLGATESSNAYSGEVFVVCHLNPAGDNFLSLRSCGATKCYETMRLGPGTYLDTMEPYAEKGWREVIVRKNARDDSYNGPKGWVYSKYICATGE